MITILQAADHSVTEGYSRYKSAEQFNLTKMFMPNGNVRSYDKATFFQLHEAYDFNGLAKLYTKLQIWSKMTNVLMVRDSLKEEFKSSEKFPRSLKSLNPRELTRLLIVDIDTLELPARISALDIKKQGNYVCDLLFKLDPETFPRGIGFIAQASSSAAYNTNKIKLHLFFNVSNLYTQTQFKNYTKSLNKIYKEKTGSNIDLVDTSIYNAVQALYICNPIFVNQKEDPFLGKSRIVYEPSKRRKLVELPHPSELALGSENIALSDSEMDRITALHSGSPYMTEHLDEVIQRVKNPDEATRTVVQACFHRAYQLGFNLDMLCDILRPLIKQVRPELPDFSETKSMDSVDSYLFEGRKVCMEKIHTNTHRELPSTHGDSVVLEEIRSVPWPDGTPESLQGKLNLPEPPEANSITFIKASLGAGKTTAVKKWMAKQLKGCTLLAITDTIALVEANCAEFNGYSFNSSSYRSNEYIDAYKTGTSILKNLKDISSGDDVDVLSGTVQSISKLEGNTRPFDVIFIDEADAVLTTILTSPTMGALETIQEDRAKAIEVLRNEIAQAKIVLLCDGDFDSLTVNGWLSLFGTKKHVFKVDHCVPNMLQHKAYFHKNVKSLWNQAYEDIASGRRCLIMTDWGPKQLHPQKLYIEGLGKTVAAIHRDSKEDKISTQILKYTDKAYIPDVSLHDDDKLSTGLAGQKLDVLLCSPSVTSGVDWHYFDSVFIINEHLNSTPALRFQASRRCRRALEYHYYCKDAGWIINGFENENQDIMEDTERHYRVELYKRESKEMNQYSANFRQYFLNQGCPVRFFENNNNPDPILMHEAKEQAMQNHCDAIMTVKDKEDKPPGYNSAWADKEMICSFHEITPEQLTDDIVMYFLKQEFKVKAEFLDRIAQHYAKELIDCIKQKSINPLLETIKANKGEFRHYTGEVPEIKPDKVEKIIKRCGINLGYECSYEQAIKDQFKYYSLYIVSDQYKVMPEILDIELNGNPETIREL